MQITKILMKAGSKIADLIVEEQSGAARSRTELLYSFLDEQGYFPTIDEMADQLNIHFANCPYLEVSENAPEVCLFDLELASSVMNASARFDKRIINGDPHCTLIVEVREETL